MRILVDNALSSRIAEGPRDAGHDAVHVRDLGLARATDDELFELAAQRDRVLLSEDTVSAPLEAGAVVVIEPERVRVRRLPIGGD